MTENLNLLTEFRNQELKLWQAVGVLKMIADQVQMLPEVDYQKIKNNFSFSLEHLEYQTMQDCCDFLNCLKSALIEEHLSQVPELLIAHICAYLGTAITVHTIHQGEKLELLIMDLIKHQAYAAYQNFKQQPINNTISSDQQKKKNVEILLDNKSPVIQLYRKHIYQLMHAYANARQN